MNKKWWILIFIVLVLAITILITMGLFKLQEEKNYKDKVTYTLNKYAAFRQNEISLETDNVTKIFNKIIKEEIKQKDINKNKITLKIDDLNTNISKIEQEINNYSIKYLEDISNYDINNVIDKSIDKNTVLNLYYDNELIKNIQNEKQKRQKYLNYLEELKTASIYLNANSKYYEIEDKNIICKNKNVYNDLKEIIKKYNLNMTIELKKINKKVPILCYHGVLDNPWGAATLFVKVTEFAKQMQYLNDNGYTPIFISEIEEAGMYEKPIIITFDDGYNDVYNYAFPILQKYNFKSNFFVVSGFINGDVYVNQEMVKKMSDSGLVEIGSHTATHPTLNTLNKEKIEYEFKNSKEVLENIIGKEVITIAYPSGLYNQDVIDVAKKYYQYGVSTDWGKENSNNINKYNLKRLYVYREYNLEQFKGLL